MKILSRDFTLKEKVLLALLAFILIGLFYYQFIFLPLSGQLASAQAEKESLQTELTTVQAQLDRMNQMQQELTDITNGGKVSMMGSYNNSKAEIDLLNDILDDANQYTVSFANVTRDGDQIRRNFTLQFTVSNYSTMEQILSQLSQSPYRCLVSEISCSESRDSNGATTSVSVNATATFFETMVGGVPDAGLPESEKADE